MAREIKFEQGFTQPGPRDYVGSAPLTGAGEPCSCPADPAGLSPDLTLSYHTQGEVIYWRFADYLPDGSLELGERLAEASGYTLETTPAASCQRGLQGLVYPDLQPPRLYHRVRPGPEPAPLGTTPGDFPPQLGHPGPRRPRLTQLPPCSKQKSAKKATGGCPSHPPVVLQLFPAPWY